MKGGKRKGSGRKVVSDNLRRNPLHSFRIQQWIIDWLKQQPESGGQLIEKAIISYYKIENVLRKTKPSNTNSSHG